MQQQVLLQERCRWLLCTRLSLPRFGWQLIWALEQQTGSTAMVSRQQKRQYSVCRYASGQHARQYNV
jgi:hypothetical protein